MQAEKDCAASYVFDSNNSEPLNRSVQFAITGIVFYASVVLIIVESIFIGMCLFLTGAMYLSF